MSASDKIRVNAAVLGPAVSTLVLYASPNGSNSNDGKSWFTPKLTVLGAYDALPSDGGTIYYESGCEFCNGTEGGGVSNTQGIWLVDGPIVPTGWRKYKTVSIIGMPQDTAGGFNTSGMAELGINPVGTDRRVGTNAVWLSGPCNHFRLENVFFDGFPGTVIRAGWDYPRDSSGNLISSNVTSAVRTSGQTVLTLSTRTYPVSLASRKNGVVTITIPASALPQGVLPVSSSCVFALTSTNGSFPGGTFQCLLLGSDGAGGGTLTYDQAGADTPSTSMAGSTIDTHGMGVNERLDLVSTVDANFATTMYRIVAADQTTVTVTDPYGSNYSNTSLTGCTATFQDRFNFGSYLFSLKNCFGQTGGNNAADVPWRGPALDFGTSTFGGFSVFDTGSSWAGYNLFHPNTSPDPDRAAAILLDGGALGAPVYCARDLTTQQGGLRAYLNSTGVVVVENFLTDIIVDGLTAGPPAVEIFVNSGAQASALVDLVNVQSADHNVPTPDVRLNGTVPSNTHTRMCGWVQGASTAISDASGQFWAGAATLSAPAQGQIGFWGADRIAGRHPGALLSFGPQASRVSNFIMGQSTWVAEHCSVSTGIDAPDGTNTAYRFVPDGTGFALLYFMFPANTDPRSGAPLTQSIGDRWAYFLWARPHSGSSPLATDMTFAPSAPGALTLTPTPDFRPDGGWQYYGTSGIVELVPNGPTSSMSVQISVDDEASQWDFWGVTVLRVPTGVLTDNEWAEIVMTLRNRPFYLTAGNCGTMEGQKLIAHGGLGIDTSVPKVAGAGSGQLTIGSIVTYEPRYAADGTTIIGWAPLYSATINP